MLRYHLLTQLEQHSAGATSHMALWELSPDSVPEIPDALELPEWAWRGIRLYCATDGSATWAGIPEGLGLDDAAQTIADKLGCVEIAE